MHIVALAWLFVVFTVALTLSPLAGVALVLVGGVAPIALVAAVAVRRRETSALERDVRERDDGES